MKTRLRIPVLVVLFLIASLYSIANLEDQIQKTQENRRLKSLVRKDLLVTSHRQLSPPVRDIFTRQRTNLGGEGLGFPGADRPQLLQGVPSQTNSGDESEEILLEMKYIGYVNSEQRVVALILFRGEVYAVESNDMLEGGISIGEITPNDIEIIGPNSQSSKVRLEGEKP